jgi:hypothetical protein
MTTTTDIIGTNPGPAIQTPQFPQSEAGNVWKMGVFTVTLSPASVAASTTAEQTFAITGLLTGDFVAVDKPTAQGGLGIVGTRVSAAGVLAITFSNNLTTVVTPTASEVYLLEVVRVQPNYTQLGYVDMP